MKSASGEHRKAAEGRGPISIAVVTVSDTRTADSDVNGKYLRSEIERVGHELADYRIISDDPEQVEKALEELGGKVRVVLFNGGTGVSARDNTFDVVDRHIEKHLPGFGELFRMLSWEQVGSAAMLSRAVGGIFRRTVLFSTPGSPAAVELAWKKLIEPELEHLVWELNR